MSEKIQEQNTLTIKKLKSPQELGDCSAADVADCLKRLLCSQEEVNMIFAAAPSQNEFLEALRNMPDIEWERINAFHMDEYIGLPEEAPQGFGNFLKRAIFWAAFRFGRYIIWTGLPKISRRNVGGMPPCSAAFRWTSSVWELGKMDTSPLTIPIPPSFRTQRLSNV